MKVMLTGVYVKQFGEVNGTSFQNVYDTIEETADFIADEMIFTIEKEELYNREKLNKIWSSKDDIKSIITFIIRYGNLTNVKDKKSSEVLLNVLNVYLNNDLDHKKHKLNVEYSKSTFRLYDTENTNEMFSLYILNKIEK